MKVSADVAPDADGACVWVYEPTGHDVLVWLIEGSLVLTFCEEGEEVVSVVALRDEDQGVEESCEIAFFLAG